MITQNNFLDVITSIPTHELVDAIDDQGDYINLRVNIFNAGFTAEIESVDSPDFDLIEDGMLSVDKDQFIILLKENNALPSVLADEY